MDLFNTLVIRLCIGLLVGCLFFLLLLLTVQAAEVSDADKDSCRPDVLQFCKVAVSKYLFDGGSSIVQCLQDNRKLITPACRATLRKHGV